MKWTLQELKAAKHKTFIINESVRFDELLKTSNDIRDMSNIRVTGEVTYPNKLITFSLKLEGELTLPCARTLADVKWPLDISFDEHFLPDGSVMPDVSEKEEVHTVLGDVIDLTPILEERILLEVPFQVYAEEGAEPLAPPSGKDWELVTEESQKDRIDPRMADLAKFFDKS
ncbi:YceD family protein [Alkalicoccobacillus plakortidis]|uniref:YceD family protein n=1 Tax=Alkalicoccobacillus plakortidis TaxID=444060 RepID=A0ABT0XFY9_9BACI|nr:YceD family protein [Alkalicoccobacillus plakortidis]MCM2674838.1 YceD family protein [Alkalicoccobacillus plakortidis]